MILGIVRTNRLYNVSKSETMWYGKTDGYLIVSSQRLGAFYIYRIFKKEVNGMPVNMILGLGKSEIGSTISVSERYVTV